MPTKPTTVDFETFGIESRPDYPPVPVGVSIKKWGKPSRYYAWGHLSQNNCTITEAKAALAEAWANPDGVLFQNGKFDVDVAEVHMGLPQPAWDKIHDTMFLLFLDDPHSRRLGLKPAAEKYLGLPPDESDAVADWLVKNQPITNVRIGKGKNSKEPAGKYIAYAPGNLVGTYANGDSDRTEGIFKKLWPQVITQKKMKEPYQREQRLMPILLESERNGVRVDLDRLRSDVKLYSDWMVRIDDWIRRELTSIDLNIDSSPQLAEALIAAGKADPALMGITPGGSVATNKAALKAGVTDRVLASVLQYRAQMKTCLGTFMTPWLEMAERSGGLIFTNWNQVKGDVGTRTGRLSSTPNFQNIPKEFAELFSPYVKVGRTAAEKRRQAVISLAAFESGLPACPWGDLPPLPLCRGYIVPHEEGDLLLGRDYSQQEPRMLAHFEDGSLKKAYVENPWIDYHDNAKEHLERVMGKVYSRKPVKNINLGIIYGQGIGSLAEKNNSTVEETKEIRDAIYALYPGSQGHV